jgi:NAD(P)H dehydrogenase (quinone)
VHTLAAVTPNRSEQSYTWTGTTQREPAMPTFLVAGCSGRTGAVVAQHLLDQKQKVRVLLRDPAKGERWKKRGAEVAVGTVEDPHAMAAVFRGASAAYLLLPPAPPPSTGLMARAKKIIEAYVQAGTGSHLHHAVFLSSVGAHVPEGTGPIQTLRLAEQQLKAWKFPVTFLRACYFVENWTPMLGFAKDGQLPTFFAPDFKFPQVSTHDIGRVAAELIGEHPKSHRVVELAGPVDASSNDVAETLGRLLGREVKASPQPLTAVAKTFEGFGFSPEYAGMFQEMYGALASGKVTWEHPDTVRRGKESLEQTLQGMLKKS